MGLKKDKKKLKKLIKVKKTIKKKYSEIVEKMRMLQICNHAIHESIIQKMIGVEEYTDKTTNGDLIYSGTIFQDIFDECCDENHEPLFSDKAIEQLNELIILCEDYQYVMVIDNPK